MWRWFAAAVCMVSMAACSQDGPAPGSSAPPASASTSPSAAADPAPGSGPEPSTGSASPSELTGRAVLAKRCFGRRATIRGTASDDRLRGTAESDVFIGFGGDDVVVDLGFQDVACTGAGNDRVVDERVSDCCDSFRVSLGSGDDRIVFVDDTRGGIDGGHSGAIRAGGGDDVVLLDRNSTPTVAPGPGDDLVRAVSVRRAAYLTPCLRYGRPSFATAPRGASGPVRVNLARGRATGQGRDRLVNIRCVVGSRFNDVLIGTDRDDEIEAAGGLNLVRAKAGDDAVFGGDRADELHLGPGVDVAYAWDGWDRVYGGPGGDVLAGYGQGDYLDGGAGDDYLFAESPCERDVGADRFAFDDDPNQLFGRSGDDGLSGAAGNDRLDGGPGVDSGQGGFRDRRIDWITSVEIHDECASPYTYR